MSAAFLAQGSSIFIWVCVPGEATVWPPSRGVATHPTSLTKGTACLPAPSQFRSRGRDPGPQRFLKFLPLLSGKGPARARQPGGHPLDSRGLPCDPIALRPGDPNTILDQTVAQEKSTVSTASGAPKVSLPSQWTGLSRDSQDRAAAHASLEGCRAKATPCVHQVWSSAPVPRGQPPACPHRSTASSWCPHEPFPLWKGCCVSCGSASSRACCSSS